MNDDKNSKLPVFLRLFSNSAMSSFVRSQSFAKPIIQPDMTWRRRFTGVGFPQAGFTDLRAPLLLHAPS